MIGIKRTAGLARRVLPLLVVAATIGGLVLAVDPGRFASALSRLNLALLPPILALGVLFYLLQGLRWHTLLRVVGVRLGWADGVLLSVAGQIVSAILPVGDLTRAIFATEASGASFGTVAATVTVQELTYTLMLVLAATPMLLDISHGVVTALLVVAVILAILAVLTVPPLFCLLHRIISRTPVRGRLLPEVERLHQETALLLRQPRALAWSGLDMLRVGVATTQLWLVLAGLSPHRLGWWQAAFVLAFSYVGGALSLVPGAAGVSEAGLAGLLVVVGIAPPVAAAAALLQRIFTTGLAMALGWLAFAVARRRFGLSWAMTTRLRSYEATMSA